MGYFFSAHNSGVRCTAGKHNRPQNTPFSALYTVIRFAHQVGYHSKQTSPEKPSDEPSCLLSYHFFPGLNLARGANLWREPHLEHPDAN